MHAYVENIRNSINVFLQKRIQEPFDEENMHDIEIDPSKHKLYDEQLKSQYWITRDQKDTDY